VLAAARSYADMLHISARALGLPVPLIFRPVPHKEAGGSPEFPDYPFEHMPRTQTPVVSLLLRHSAARTAAFQCIQSVGFHRSSRLILLTTTIHFSGFNHAACALASPLLRTPPLSDRTSVPLQARWLTFDLSGLACKLLRLTRWVIMTHFKDYLLSQRPVFSSARECNC